MGATEFISVDEYLRTSYTDGDLEYLDGRLAERYMGEAWHSRVEGLIAAWLYVHYKQFWSGIACRVRIGPSRYRIPDVALLTGQWPVKPGPLTDPPFLVVEVLSSEDPPGEMQERIADYRACGVQYIWVVDSTTGGGEIYTATGSYSAGDGVLRTQNPVIEVPLAALFGDEPVS
jgi:Uma2 family endonuclease